MPPGLGVSGAWAGWGGGGGAAGVEGPDRCTRSGIRAIKKLGEAMPAETRNPREKPADSAWW